MGRPSRGKYPDNWDEIATRVKDEAVGQGMEIGQAVKSHI